jgi:hypothetical protein
MMLVFVALAQALRRWEPGFRLSRIIPEQLGPDGVAVFTLAGIFFPLGHLGDTSRGEERSARYANDQTRVWIPATEAGIA